MRAKTTLFRRPGTRTRRRGSTRAAHHQQARLRLEPLEQRRMLSVTPGTDFYVDASLDTDGDSRWEDQIGATGFDFELDSNTVGGTAVTRVAATSAFPGITAAYDFVGGSTGNVGGALLRTAGSGTNRSFQNAPGDWSNEDVTFEIWFKPDELTPDTVTNVNGQILFEDGGGTGFGFYLDPDNNELRLRKAGGGGNVAYDLVTDSLDLINDLNDGVAGQSAADVTSEFIQAVGTYDIPSGTMELFVNGVSVGTAAPGGGDWTGGDGAGLGTRGASNTGGIGGGQQSTESFDGKIASFRVYRNQILTDAEVLANYNAVVVGNRPPDATGDGANANEDGPAVTGNVLANDTDPDGDPLAVQSVDTTGTLGSVTLAELQKVGEVGSVSVDHNAVTVSFSAAFDVAPVVIAQPPSVAGADDAVAMISNVTTSGFSIEIEEPSNLDGSHAFEMVYWVALKPGEWVLNDGTLLEVGTIDTQTASATSGIVQDNVGTFETVAFASGFSAAPVVLSQAQTQNGAHPDDFFKTRQRNATAGGFDVAIEEDDGGDLVHVQETIGYVAIEAGTGGWAGDGLLYDAGITANAVTEAAFTFDFNVDFGTAPRFVAAMATYDGADPAELRLTNLSPTSATVFVEEDQVGDSETNHADEEVSYLVIGGSGTGTLTAYDASGGFDYATDNGAFNYDPNGQFESLAVGETATDTFTYVVTDGHGGTDTATVTVTIAGENDAPTEPVDVDANDNEVVENAANGTAVGITASSTDVDNGATIAYGITADSSGGGFQIDASSGVVTVADGTLLDYEAATSHTITVEASDGAGGTSSQTFTIDLINQTATIIGQVFVDVDVDGLFDGGTETGIDGVTVTLLGGTEGTQTDVTSLGGVYAFVVNDEFATYNIVETQPTGVDDGAAYLGDAGGTVISSNEMQLTLAGTDAADYYFTELGQAVEAGDTATIGFWQNKHGQELIQEGGDALVDWLSTNFGNVFGTTFSDADGGDDAAEVASFYKNEFFAKKLRGTSKVDAQFMATALATFFTSSNLAGSDVAADYGFTVTETGIGTKVVNVGSSGAAFGVADDTDMTIMAMLLATNGMTDTDGAANNDDDGYTHVYDANGDGVIDAAEKALREMANEVYTAINEGGHI